DDFGQPCLSLCFRTRNDNIEHPSTNCRNATEIEYAVPPDGFEWIAEDGLFSGTLGVRGIEDDGAVGLEQAAWNAFAFVSLQKLVGHSRPHHPVHPAFQYRGRLTPPVRMNDNNA